MTNTTNPKKRGLTVPSDSESATGESVAQLNNSLNSSDQLVGVPSFTQNPTPTSKTGGQSTVPSGTDEGYTGRRPAPDASGDGYTLTGDEKTDLENIASHYKPADLDDNTWRGMWKSVFSGESGNNINEGESKYGRLPKGKRASGGMQVLPSTARGLGFTDEEFEHPYNKFMAGVKNLRTEYDNFGSDKRVQGQEHRIALAFAAYFTGKDNVLASLDRGEDGVPNTSDGKVNTREYTKQKIDFLQQFLSQAGSAAPESGEPALLTDEEAMERLEQSPTGTESTIPVGKGVLDDPAMKALMEMPAFERGLAIIDKMGVDPAMAALDESIRGKLGVVSAASHPHKVARNVPLLFEVPTGEDGKPQLTADAVRDAVTIALTGDTSLPEAFRRATGENPGEFLSSEEANEWLKQALESGALRVREVGGKVIAEGNVPVQNWVVNRINALATGGIAAYNAETTRMRQEIADNERLVAEEEYTQAINEAKRNKDEIRAAELQAELNARYPKTLTEDLTSAIRAGTARGISELLRTGMNIEQLVEAPIADAITDDKDKRKYVGKKAQEAKQARLLQASLEAKTPSARRLAARMAEGAVKEVIYAPVYMMGGAVMGPAGLIYTTALRDADEPMDKFLQSVAASIIELPFGTAFKGLIAGKDIGALAAKSGAMASGGLGEVAGDAIVDLAKGEVPKWEEVLSNLVIGAAFELGEGSHEGTKEGGYQMKGVGEGGAVPTELRSFIGVTQGEDGQLRFQGVIKRGENVGLIEIDPQHPMLLKYALQAQEGGIPFVAMKNDEFDQALQDFTGTGKVTMPKMTAEQMAAYMRGEQTATMKGGKLTTAGESTNEQKESDEQSGDDASLPASLGTQGVSSETEVSEEKEGGKTKPGKRVLKNAEQKQADKEASLSDEEYRKLEAAYDKLGTTDEAEIRNLIRQSDRRFVKKIQGTTEGEFAQRAYERVSSLTTEEQQALSKVIEANFVAPSRTPTIPGETSDYSASISGMTDAEFEANPQLVANEREVGEFFKEAQQGNVVTAETAEEKAEGESGAQEFKKEQESITQGDKKVKVGRASVTLPKDLAARWEQADIEYESASSKIQNSKLGLDEKRRELRNAVEARKKKRDLVIDEYRGREAEQIQRGYLRDSDRPVAILEVDGQTLTVQVAGEDGTREVNRSEVETRKERALKKTKKAKLPVGIRMKLGLGGFSELNNESHAAEGVVYINDKARSAIEDAIGAEVDLGFTVRRENVPIFAKTLRDAGLKRIATQLENSSEGRAGAAIVPVNQERAAETRFHEQIHTVAYDKRLPESAVSRLFDGDSAMIALLEALQTSKEKMMRDEFDAMNPYDFIQEVIAYGLTGDFASLGVDPDLLYDALVDVMGEYLNAFPNEDLESIAELALINYDAVVKEASRRNKDAATKAERNTGSEVSKQKGSKGKASKDTGTDKKRGQGRSKKTPEGGRVARAVESRADQLVNSIRQLRTGEGPVEIEKLRDEFPELRLERFHQLLRDLVDQGRIFVHRRDDAASLSAKQKDRLLKIGDRYYGAVTIAINPTSEALILRARGRREELNQREENFRKWFEGSEVVDEDGTPLMVYHGTTHDFESFTLDRANFENFVGRGFYFTTSPLDAAGNYGHEGTDLTARISQKLEDSYESRQYEADELRSQLEDTEDPDEIEELERQIEELEDDDLYRAKIKKEMTGKAEIVIIPAFLSAKNLFDISSSAPSEKSLETEVEMIPDEFSEDPDDMQPGEPTGSLVEFIDNFYNALTDFTDVGKAEEVKAKLIENLPDELWYEGGSVSHKKVFDAAKDAMMDAYLIDYLDYDVIEPGQQPNGEILRRTAEASGFDGIKMVADDYFGSMVFMRDAKYDDRGMLTEHYIVWEPRNIKSPYNNGNFNPDERSFLRKVDNRRNEEPTFAKNPVNEALRENRREIQDLQAASPMGNDIEGASKRENETYFTIQMALPERMTLSATGRKQIINRRLLGYDAKEWKRHAEWAKGEALDQNESSNLYALLQQGFAASTRAEHDQAIQALQDFVDEVSSQNIFEFLLNARRAGMLSGVKTAGRNILSNAVHLVAEELKRGGSAPMEMVLTLMSNNKERATQGVSPLGISYALRRGLTDGFRAFKDTIVKGNTGATYETFNLGYDPHVTPSWMTLGKSGAWFLNNTVGTFAKYVFRFQAAQDAIFRTYAYNRAMYEIAWLEQKNGGRKIADVLANPTVGQSDIAWRAAEFAVFQNDNFINTGYQRWKGDRSEIVKYVLDYQLPFIKTGSNIFLQSMDYLVIGSAVKATTALSKETLKDVSKGDWKKIKQKMWNAIDDPDTRAVISESFGRGLVGIGLAVIGYKLAAAGLMYGFGDEDEKERQRRVAQGAGPGHMKLGNRWIDIRALSPVGTLMLAGASAYRAQNKELSGENTRADAFMRLFTSMVSEGLPMARTASEFLNPKQGQSYVKRLIGAGSLVPAIVSEVAAIQDDVQREQKGDGLGDSIKKEVQSRLPKTPVNPDFNRKSLPPKTDVFGRELEQPFGMDPLATKKDKGNKILEEASSVGWSMTPPKRDTKKGESQEDFQDRKKKTQDLINRVFEELVNNTEYPLSAPKAERKEILDDSASLARRAIKTGEKVSDAELQEIVKLTIGKWKERAEIDKDPSFSEKEKKKYKNRISSKYSQYIKGELSDDDN